ncbi:NF038120 family PEP-CTERM protein [Roseateles sp.]|uniref:NF038120 family PEP-CTERM protein n=1 Tax=Roseateles sp. TaxID=1971397 RepID=UPI0032645305
MKKLLTSIALAAAALTVATGAQANVLRTTIDFETPIGGSPFLSYPGSPLLGHNDEFYQPGIGDHALFFDPFSNLAGAQTGDLVGSIGTNDDFCIGFAGCPTNNATNYLALLDDGFVVFGALDGFSFSVKSFSAAWIGNGDPLQTTPGFVRLQGVSGGMSTTATFALTGTAFSTFSTGGFGNIEFDYVYAYAFACQPLGVPGTSCSSNSTDRAQFALDDIVIEHVPEPASLALLSVAGLAAFRASRRRAV